VYTAADDKHVTVFIRLDVSAAFDTIDHEVLLQRLQSAYGVTDITILSPFLSGKSYAVCQAWQHQSPAVGLDVGIPQRSVIGSLLFAAYCSPAADVIVSHVVQFHQYADDTQLRLAMSSDNTSDSLYSLRVVLTSDNCTHKTGCSSTRTSRTHCIGTANQLRTTNSAIRSVCVADDEQPVTPTMSKVLSVALDRRLAFDKHVLAVTRSCNFHAQAIRHIATYCRPIGHTNWSAV